MKGAATQDGFAEIRRRGLMLVLSSPSGAGKTTISRRLLQEDDNFIMSVSATTRPKRPGEVAGVDYHFIDKTEFGLRINRGEFLEYAEVFGHYYGTPRRPVEEVLGIGKEIIFDIDWQGAQQLGQAARDDLVSIFILPPSTRILERRLKSRAQDSEEVVTRRMAKAADEMSHWAEYDYVVVNDDLAVAISKVQAIVAAERLKRHRQVGLAEFVKILRDGR